MHNEEWALAFVCMCDKKTATILDISSTSARLMWQSEIWMWKYEDLQTFEIWLFIDY